MGIIENTRPGLLLVVHDPSNNAIGRAYCLWQLSRLAGYRVRVVTTSRAEVWFPFRGTDFAADIYQVSAEELPSWGDFAVDLLVPVKAWPQSFGVARGWSVESGIPLLLDVDDPDLDAVLAFHSPFRRLMKRIIKARFMRECQELWEEARRVPTTVSNPELQRVYGGEVIPHVRQDLGPGTRSIGTEPMVVFVGSNRKHKGLSQLREAIFMCHHLGYRLTVTDEPPADAKEWESWVGRTSFEEGLRLVASSDIVVIPSQPGVWADKQLPAKLIDAMIFGRAVVASDVAPIRWALAGTGLLCDASDSEQLSQCLSYLIDEDLRQRLGARAREVALARYTPQAAADGFRRACEVVLSR